MKKRKYGADGEVRKQMRTMKKKKMAMLKKNKRKELVPGKKKKEKEKERKRKIRKGWEEMNGLETFTYPKKGIKIMKYPFYP